MSAAPASPSLHTLLWLPNCWLLRICCVIEQSPATHGQSKLKDIQNTPAPTPYIYMIGASPGSQHTECQIWLQCQCKVTSVPGFLIYKVEVSNTDRCDLKSSCFRSPKAGVIGLYHYTWLKCLLLNIVFWNTSGMSTKWSQISCWGKREDLEA